MSGTPFNLASSNNALIELWEAQYLPQINAEKERLGIKHNRTRKPVKSKIKNRKQKGEINRISVSMSFGDIMTHKGKGPGNRTEKPWFNPVTEVEVGKLADQIAENTGDVIAGNIAIR